MKTKTKTLKIKCTNNNYSSNLTIGNEYAIIKEEDGKVYVKNDAGKVTPYYKSRFL